MAVAKFKRQEVDDENDHVVDVFTHVQNGKQFGRANFGFTVHEHRVEQQQHHEFNTQRRRGWYFAGEK